MKKVRITALIVLMITSVYIIISSLLVLDLYEHVEIAKMSKTDYVKYNGISYKNIESFKVAVMQKQYSKWFIECFMDFPKLALQLLLAYVMVFFSVGLKILCDKV